MLVIGSGGREHALAWRLAQSARVSRVYVAPGNAGTAREDGAVQRRPRRRFPSWSAFARREDIHATVVGPEAPLAAGVVDAFREAGLRIFGPTKAAAQLESSKDFAKRFMARHAHPHRALRDLHATRRPRTPTWTRHGAPIVVKADGLAAGKGVVVAMTLGRGARRGRHDARRQQARATPATAW